MKKVYILGIFFFYIFIPFSSRCLGQEVKEEFFFTIQVGSYLGRDLAHDLEEKLIKKGYPAYLSEFLNETGQTIYRVRIGKFETRRDAESLAGLLHSKEKMSYLITKTISKKIPSSVVTAPMTTTPMGATSESLRTPPVPEPVPEKRESIPWPQSISKIYTYMSPEGTLHVTNVFNKIPEELRDRIESISIFPVRFISFDRRREVLHLQIDEKDQWVELIGVAIPSPLVRDIAATYFEKNLRDLPLAFVYCPRDYEHKEGILLGTLYHRQGKSINLEMVRQGIAPCFLENIPLSQRQAFVNAESLARKERAGLWAVSDRKE